MIVVDNLRHRRGGSKICFKFHVERSVSYFLDLYQFSRPLSYKRSHLCYSVVSVCLLSVTYVLWLNGVSYQELPEEANRKWSMGIEWSHDRRRQVTLKSQGRNPIRLGPNIS